MRTIGSDFFSYLSERTVSQQVENDIRIISKKRNKMNIETQAVPQEVKDSYEQAMDTSKYDQILNELTI